MRLDAQEYQRILGEELRALRKQQGLTRRELAQRLDSDISLQTLATYELGTRHCSVVRLVELCLAMQERPQDLLDRVQRRTRPEQPGDVRVSLRSLAAVQTPDLAPLRRWAQDRLTQKEPVSAGEDIALDTNAIGWLAQLCGMDTAPLLARLRELTRQVTE